MCLLTRDAIVRLDEGGLTVSPDDVTAFFTANRLGGNRRNENKKKEAGRPIRHREERTLAQHRNRTHAHIESEPRQNDDHRYEPHTAHGST